MLAAVIHHTATPNGYASNQVAGIIRSLYLYQTRGNGLADLAFNYLVDAQGRIYEGRYGGIDQNVVGSHTAGFNTGTVGIALIGNFSKSAPAAKQVQALDSLLAWRLDVGARRPEGARDADLGGQRAVREGPRGLVPDHLRPSRRRQHRLPGRRRLLEARRRSGAPWRRRAT